MTTDLFYALEQIDADNPISDEYEKRLETSSTEKKREEKRAQRISDCGKWSNWYNPHNGERTGFVFQCGLFRYCDACLKKRAEEEYELLKIAALDKHMVMKIVTSKEATNLIRKVDKTEYIRYPQENGNDLLFLDESVGMEGVAVNLGWVMRQDWTTIVQTPEGRNKSGTMHMPVDDETPDEFSIINTKQFITNANRRVTNQAMGEAIRETASLDPKTPDAVVAALRKRVGIATNKLRQQGFTVTIYDKRLKLIHSLVDWTGQRSGRIKRLYTENPTRANQPEHVESLVARKSVAIPTLIA